MKDLVKKTRGTVNQFADDSLEFVPQGKGEPVYEHSYKVGEAQIGLTKGKGKQNFVAHLKCSADKPFVIGLLIGHIFNRWHKDGVSFDLLQISMKENTLFLQICRDAGLNHMNVECV